jgi:hypothetical protein
MVHHPPRLQLGDAPLFPFGASQSDQVEILWQTLPAGEGDRDQFTVEYRSAEGNAAWNAVDVNPALDTGVEGRLIHSTSIMGLDYDQAYDYRVLQLRDKVVVDAFQSTFRTRLPVSHPTPFSFAAYGDSAFVLNNDGFRAVQARVNQSSADFTLLLGDNIYEVGRHDEADARFSASFSPEATEWVASRIDYFAAGNHDIAFQPDISFGTGQPSRDNFSVPVPRAGINAHAEPPASEPPEHNYSFDYGSAHFATFDTNSLNDPERLDGLLAWLEHDLAASDAAWKIVFGHHPVAFAPDKKTRTIATIKGWAWSKLSRERVARRCASVTTQRREWRRSPRAFRSARRHQSHTGLHWSTLRNLLLLLQLLSSKFSWRHSLQFAANSARRRGHLRAQAGGLRAVGRAHRPRLASGCFYHLR